MNQLVKYSSHYLSSSEMRQRLSPMEASFARRHDDLLQKHYNMAFLQSFPPQLRRMDDTTGGTSMIDLPDLDTPVFIRARKACVVFGRGITSDDEVDAHPGEVLIARWSDVKPLYLNGDVELV